MHAQGSVVCFGITVPVFVLIFNTCAFITYLAKVGVYVRLYVACMHSDVVQLYTYSCMHKLTIAILYNTLHICHY